MPGSQVWNIEWSNLNGQRAYPLADDAAGNDDTGTFKLPNSFLISLDLPIHAGLDVDPARFFIKHIGAYATGFSVVVGYQPAVGDPVDVATALIARQGHTRNKSYALGGVDPYDDTMGKVGIGRLDDIDLQPPGFFTFEFAQTRLDPDAIRPIIRGISSIVVVNGNQRSAPLVGQVELMAGANMQLVPIVILGQDPKIVFNAINGEGLTNDCVCEGEPDAEPIRTIDGVGPAADGNLDLFGTECAQFVPVTGGLKLVNTCAKPCCGCPELEKITQDLEFLNRQVATVQDLANRLMPAVDTMNLVVLGAKIGSSACIQCE